ncbi:hypothetical protein [Streptomyces sp. NPDC059597]|uniref:hypothetical protein n=1 Tax=Streptomyces sp. NPDC059597 TaxID=3346879 RepID=UPI003676D52B
MPKSRTSRLRALAVLVAVTATTTFASGLPAHADSSVDGSITRSEVLNRAQSWVDAHVPYNQSGHWGGYREDCSGYVSMAWHLSTSLVTQTLPSVSTKESYSSLKPGDIMDYTADHTFLFAGWTNKANGDFTYYAESNPNDPTHGPTHANINSSSIEGWPTSNYDAYRYQNIVDDPVTPTGTVWDRTRSASGGWDAHATEIDDNSAVTAVASATLPDGTVHVLTIVPGSGVWDRVRSASGAWAGAATKIDSNGGITAVSAAALPDGTLHVQTLVPGAGVWDRTRSASGSWSSSSQIDSNGNITALASSGLKDGTLHVQSLVPGSGIWDRTRSSSGSWSSSTKIDDNGDISAIASAALSDGSLHVDAVVPGSGVWDRTRSSAGTWAGAATQIDANGDVASVSASALPDGSLHVDAVVPGSGVWDRTPSSAGAWWSGGVCFFYAGGGVGRPPQLRRSVVDRDEHRQQR